MKIKTVELLKALEAMNALNHQREPIANLVLMAFDPVDDMLTLQRATYEEIFCFTLEGSVGEMDVWRRCVKFKPLLNVVKRLKKEKTIHLKPNETHGLKVENLTLAGLNPDKAPSFLTYSEFEERREIETKEFKEAMEVCSSFMSDNEARKNLTGLNLKSEEGKRAWTSGDGFRIARYQPEKEVSVEDYEVLLPSHLVKTWKKAIKFIDDEIISFSCIKTEEEILIAGRNFDYVCRYHSYLEFPNLDSLLKTGEPLLTTKTADVLDAMELLKAAVEPTPESVIKLQLSEEKALILSQPDEENSQTKVELKQFKIHKPFKIGLNFKFFHDALKIAKSRKIERLEMFCNNSESPLVIQHETDTLTILPVKIKW